MEITATRFTRRVPKPVVSAQSRYNRPAQDRALLVQKSGEMKGLGFVKSEREAGTQKSSTGSSSPQRCCRGLWPTGMQSLPAIYRSAAIG